MRLLCLVGAAAFAVCALAFAFLTLKAFLRQDQFAQFGRQREELIATGRPVKATVTSVQSGSVAYEYWLEGRKHYGSCRLREDGIEVGQSIEVTVSSRDPDISAYRPERALAGPIDGPVDDRLPSLAITIGAGGVSTLLFWRYRKL